MSQELLLDYYLKRLKLPTVRRLYKDLARDAAEHNKTFEEYLQALMEQEVIHREDNQLQRRLKAAGFPVPKTLESFDFTVIPSVNKAKILALSKSEHIRDRENVLFVGNSGTGKTHLATALGIAACRQGYRVHFWRVGQLVAELQEAQNEHRLNRFEKQWLRLDYQLANSRKGPWRMAGGPLNSALGDAYWRAQGLISLTECYEATRQSWRTAGCGPACPVV